MPVPVVLTWANPAEGTCPTTIDEAVALYRTLLTGEVSGTFTPYVLGFDTPAVEDQDKAWIRTDAVGRPLGTFIFYAGGWRREYTGKQQEITLFHGNPATYFDGTGKGLITGTWDGWALCNGQNGTPNLSDKFLVAGHMDNSAGQTGFVTNWRTLVSGTILATGGVAATTLTTAQIPRDASPALLLDTFSADGNARADAGSLYGVHSVATGIAGYDTVVDADAGEASPDAFSNLPPYLAIAYAIFIGYS